MNQNEAKINNGNTNVRIDTTIDIDDSLEDSYINNTGGTITSDTTVNTTNNGKSTNSGRDTRSDTPNTDSSSNKDINYRIQTAITSIHDANTGVITRINRRGTDIHKCITSVTEMHGTLSSTQGTNSPYSSNDTLDDFIDIKSNQIVQELLEDEEPIKLDESYKRSNHDTWEECNLVPISPEYLKSSLLSGRLPYAGDELKVKRIHEILRLICNYAFAECMRDILRYQLKDHALTTLFETLINIIHSQFMFSDEQSQVTFTCQIANIATILIDLGITNWTPDAIRCTTSGLKIKPLNMYYKQS
jgi:hypothetical protein